MKASADSIFLVIPTVRTLDFLSEWKDEFKNCSLIIVEDHDEQSISLPAADQFKEIFYYNHQHIEKDLGKDAWIISYGNAAIRSYGYYKAWQKGAKYIITLDDDCYPAESDFVQKHIDNLQFKAATNWIASYPSTKWNYTRGFPYQLRDQEQTAVSHGLWGGALDLDGQTEIKLKKLLTEKPYPSIRQVIPNGYYYPLCGMNLAFLAEATPVMFFPMMGLKQNGESWGFNRFDDIWAGVLSKKVLDHLHYATVNGSPFIDHRKASNPGSNFEKEKTGIKVNEDFWKWVDVVKLTKSTLKECYIELAEKAEFPDDPYFNSLRKAMIIWAELF